MTNQTYVQKTTVASELLSLASAKKHLLIESSCTDFDTYIESLITTARKTVENYTGILIGEQTWYLYQNEIEYITEIIKLPVNSIVSYSYLDEDGDSKNLENFTTVHEDIKGKPSRIEVEDIPSLYEWGFNKFTVEFKAGYTTLPEPLEQAMLLMIGHWFENRQDVVTGTQVNEVPETSKYLMQPYCYYEFR